MAAPNFITANHQLTNSLTYKLAFGYFQGNFLVKKTPQIGIHVCKSIALVAPTPNVCFFPSSETSTQGEQIRINVAAPPAHFQTHRRCVKVGRCHGGEGGGR